MGKTLFVFLTAFCWAQEIRAEKVSGLFATDDATLDIVEAYAFRGQSAFDGEDVWIVAATNGHIIHQQVDRYVDRRYVLDNYFRDARIGVVYFEFDDGGGYRGLSYDFSPENRCQACWDDSVKANVVIDEGRIVGSLSWSGPERRFELEVDLATSPVGHGEALPDGGGEPGKAYRAFHQAIRSRDEVSLRMAFSSALNNTWTEAAEFEQAESFLQSWIDDHMSEIDRIEGWTRGDEAVLVAHGTRGEERLRAEVLLVREEDGWRVDDELVRLAN